MWENEATSMEPFQQYLAETFPEDSWPSSLQAEWTDYKLVKQLTDRQNSLQASWTGQSSWTGYKSSTLYSLPTRKPSYFHVWLHTYQCRASACGWNSKDITRAKFRGPWSAVCWHRTESSWQQLNGPSSSPCFILAVWLMKVTIDPVTLSHPVHV